MKKLGLYCLLCLGMWALAAGEVSAQDMKLVSGRIVNKNTKKPFGQEAVFIYAFNTVAEAEDARKVIDSKNGFFESSSMEAASADGYYQITVPETGALIFKVGVVDCVLEKVNYRLEINVEIESNEILKASSRWTRTMRRLTGTVSGRGTRFQFQRSMGSRMRG